MSDLAKDLLSQYYGLSGESNSKKFLSLHQSVESAKGNEEKSTVEQTSLTTNEDILSEEKDSHKDINDCDKTGTFDEDYKRSSCVLNDTDDDDETIEDLYAVDVDLGPNIVCTVFDDTQSSAAKDKSDNIPLSSAKTGLDVLGTEEIEGNDLSLTFTEDVPPDSASDISSVLTLKRSQRSLKICTTPLPPVPKKDSVCNETFVDFSNMGLRNFPLEILDRFSKLKMLYLENNDLTDLPYELFTSLRNLEWLDVRNNQLITLPTSIKFHSCLESLLLQGNKIEQLPLELCLLPKLKTLHVTQNPLIVPPKDIVASGCSGILDFLRTEWNKLHPEDQVKPIEKKIEPKPSTILCYISPRSEKRPKIVQTKSTLGILNTSKNKSIRQKSKSYKPSNRYFDAKNNVYVKSESKSPNESAVSTSKVPLCESCLQKFADSKSTRSDRTASAKGSVEVENPQEKHVEKYSLLKMICNDMFIKEDGDRREIDHLNNKVLRLMGPSCRSMYVRKNVPCLKTIDRSFKKEYQNRNLEKRHGCVTSVKMERKGALVKENRRNVNTESVEKIFDIITKDGKRLKLRPMRLQNSDWMLSCLENYIGMNIN